MADCNQCGGGRGRFYSRNCFPHSGHPLFIPLPHTGLTSDGDDLGLVSRDVLSTPVTIIVSLSIDLIIRNVVNKYDCILVTLIGFR
jgi:hypothetical protein